MKARALQRLGDWTITAAFAAGFALAAASAYRTISDPELMQDTINAADCARGKAMDPSHTCSDLDERADQNVKNNNMLIALGVTICTLTAIAQTGRTLQSNDSRNENNGINL